MSAPGEGGGLVERIAAVLAAAIQTDPATDTPRWEARRIANRLAAALLALVQAEQAAAWDEGFDAGERDVWEHHEHGFDTPCIANPYRERADRIERGE